MSVTKSRHDAIVLRPLSPLCLLVPPSVQLLWALNFFEEKTNATFNHARTVIKF
jgi:hypothetical protein